MLGLNLATRVVERLGLFPRAGDIVEVTQSFKAKAREHPKGDWRTQWILRDETFLILKCSWRLVRVEGRRLPLSEGHLTMVHYGNSSGWLELVWHPMGIETGHAGALGFMRPGATGESLRSLFSEGALPMRLMAYRLKAR